MYLPQGVEKIVDHCRLDGLRSTSLHKRVRRCGTDQYAQGLRSVLIAIPMQTVTSLRRTTMISSPLVMRGQ